LEEKEEIVLLLRIYTKNFTAFLSKTKRGLKRNILFPEMFSGSKNAEQNPLSSYP
jgi:hypothetical protein